MENPDIQNQSKPAGLPVKTINKSHWFIWGLVVIIILCTILLSYSFILERWNKKNNPSGSPINPAAPSAPNLPPQTVWVEDFEKPDLSGWTMDWMAIHEFKETDNRVLMGYRNLISDKQFPVKFTTPTSGIRYFYAQSPSLPLDFSKPYNISFDFHGKGPLEFLQFGHIFLRLMEYLPDLYYDAEGNGNYRSFNLASWSPDDLARETNNFLIVVQPTIHSYELFINTISVGKVSYSDKIKPLPEIQFSEIVLSKQTTIHAVYYDNFIVYGVPTRAVKLPETKLVTKSITTTTPISASPIETQEFLQPFNEGIEKYNGGDMENSIVALNKAVKINSQSAKAYYWIGMAYQNKGDTTAAWNSWLKALSVDSTYAPARKNLGME